MVSFSMFPIVDGMRLVRLLFDISNITKLESFSIFGGMEPEVDYDGGPNQPSCLNYLKMQEWYTEWNYC